MDWFYYQGEQYKQTKVKNIFQRFYVPSADLYPSKAKTATLDRFICSFGLKYSAIFQQTLVTLIFISYYKEGLQNGVGTSMEMISNTYDWSRPCPPICKL